MPETGENVAAEFGVSRADQDAFALRSQQRALAAQAAGVLADEIVPVILGARQRGADCAREPAGVLARGTARGIRPPGRGGPVQVTRDEHPRETSLEALARL